MYLSKTKFTQYVLIIFSLIFLGLSQSVRSEPPPANLKLVTQPFSESFSATVPVSGRVLVGALYAPNRIDDTIHLHIPSHIENKKICLRAQSRDGSYNAENIYELSSSADSVQLLEIDYPSKYKDIIKKLGNDEFALIAYFGDCSVSESKNILLTGRGKIEQKEIMIFANSGRSDVYIQVQVEDNRQSNRCKRITEGLRTGYDTICKIDSKILTDGSNKINLIRRQGTRNLPPISFYLHL